MKVLKKLYIKNIDAITDKGSGLVNEDSYFVTHGDVLRGGVFDGVTGYVGYVNNHGETAGKIASRITAECFKHSSGSLIEAAMRANYAILQAMLAEGIDTKSKIKCWATTCAAVETDGITLDWVQIADSLILIIYHDGTYELPVKDYDIDRENLLLWKSYADQGMRFSEIKDKMTAHMRRAREQMNVSFGALNGDPNARRFLKSGTCSLEGVAHVVLFTDGLILPKKDPNLPDDFDTFVSLFLNGGISAVLHHVRKIENTDTDCLVHARFKKHDDGTAVVISFV